MKRFTAMLCVAMLLIAAVVTFTVPALAYNAVDGTAWVKSVEITDTNAVKITLGEGFTGANGAGGWRMSIFETKPELPAQDDAGFWIIFNGTNAVVYEDNGSGAVKTVERADYAFKRGVTYYIGLVGLNGDWTWSQDLYSFVYNGEGVTGDKAAAKGGTEINLIAWDNFSKTTNDFLSAWDNGQGATTTVGATTGADDAKSLFIKTAGSGINSAGYNPNFGGQYSDFVNNRGSAFINANTKAIALRIATDYELSFNMEGSRWNEADVKNAYITATGDDIMMIDAETGIASVVQMRRSDWSRNLMIIPAGFDGYVILPTSRFTISDKEDAVGDWNSGDTAGYCYFWITSFFVERLTGTDTTLEIKDMYVVNEDLPTYNTADKNWVVIFEDQDGNKQYAAKNAENKVTIPDFTAPAGKYLKEWNTKKDGLGDKIDADTVYEPNGDITVYSILEDEVQYTYYVGESKNTGSSVNGVLVLPEDPDGADGKVFKEWNSQADGKGDRITAENLEAGMTIYAIFEEEAPSDTADLSVIGYALAAISGCGMLVIRRKRR